MKKPVSMTLIVLIATLAQSAVFANIPSYYVSPPTQSSTGNTSSGNTTGNGNGSHFSTINPYGNHNRNYDINSNETTIDNTYQPIIQLDCTHDDSCPPTQKQGHFKTPYTSP